MINPTEKQIAAAVLDHWLTPAGADALSMTCAATTSQMFSIPAR